MFFFKVEFEAPVGTHDESAFVRTTVVSVFAVGADDDVLVGRMLLEHFLHGDAVASGFDLAEVCDQDSQTLYDLRMAMLTRKGNFQSSLKIDPLCESILFLKRAVFHDCIKPYAQGIVNAVSKLFGTWVCFVTWYEASPFTDAELRELGFAKIANTPFIFSQKTNYAPYDKKHPRGLPEVLDLVIPDTAEAWVNSQWGD